MASLASPGSMFSKAHKDYQSTYAFRKGPALVPRSTKVLHRKILVDLVVGSLRSSHVIHCQESPRQTKPKKGTKRKVHEFWCFSLGKQARFTSNFCSSLPPGKVHELAFLWFGLPGLLLTLWACFKKLHLGSRGLMTTQHWCDGWGSGELFSVSFCAKAM